MAINIRHTYCAHVEVIFYPDSHHLWYKDVGTMDEIAERVCEVMVKHNFACADICSAETGEVLMIIERT